MNRRQVFGLALPLIAAPSLVLAQADPYQPTEVPIREGFEVGSIIVVSDKFFLYHVTAPDRAIRYGVAVGQAELVWKGKARVGRKAEWPIWTPPKEMIKRQPEAAKYAGGMAPGLDNPLGARTLYLYQNGRYTLYTIYSTSDPETIGTNLTSGCTGLLTQDMMDLYSKTPVKTKVIVLPA